MPRRGPVPEAAVLEGLPPVREVGAAEVAARISAGPRLVVLDDDPTGTQTVADVPVLTSWTVDDLRWALRQDSAAFFVLTNTRCLAPEHAAARNREVVRALHTASAAEGGGYVLASRSDSTLRGHFPLETDVLAEELTGGRRRSGRRGAGPRLHRGGPADRRLRHWMRTADGLLPVGESEFARDATFGYRSSSLPEWVEEKTGGRVPAEEVLRITLDDLRRRRPGAHGAAAVLAARRTDGRGRRGVRRRSAGAGPGPRPAEETARGCCTGSGPPSSGPAAGRPRAHRSPRRELRPLRGDAPHGLIAVGSHVALTTRQLDRLRERGGIAEYELDVPALLDEERRDAHIAEVAPRRPARWPPRDVVIRTSRTLVTGADADDSLAIARRVSAALVETVRRVNADPRPALRHRQGRHHLQRHRHPRPGDPPCLGARHAAARHRLALGARGRPEPPASPTSSSPGTSAAPTPSPTPSTCSGARDAAARNRRPQAGRRTPDRRCPGSSPTTWRRSRASSPPPRPPDGRSCIQAGPAPSSTPGARR